MKEYIKIQTIFKRDPLTNHKTLLEGDYSLPEFDYLKNNIWVFTEKVDGTNIRVMWDGKEIAFGGKTDNAQIPAFLVKKLQDRFLPQAQQFVEKFGVETTGVCLYGEGYGAKIQKGGGNYRQDQDFVLFDVLITTYKGRENCLIHQKNIKGTDELTGKVHLATQTESISQKDFVNHAIISTLKEKIPNGQMISKDVTQNIYEVQRERQQGNYPPENATSKQNLVSPLMNTKPFLQIKEAYAPSVEKQIPTTAEEENLLRSLLTTTTKQETSGDCSVPVAMSQSTRQKGLPSGLEMRICTCERVNWWLQREDVEDIAKFFGLDVVPIIGEGTLTEMVEQTRKGFNSIWGNFLAEGIVARPQTELLCRNGSRLITKIKHKDFRSA